MIGRIISNILACPWLIGYGKEERERVRREIGAAERLIERPKNEGRMVGESVRPRERKKRWKWRERENGKKRQKKKKLAFFLLLIKFSTFVSEGDWERDWQGHGCRERKRRREQLEIINRLIKLLFKERWIDRDEEQGNRRADSERGLGSMSGRETWWADVRGREMWWKRPEGKRHGGGRREKAVGSQESRLEGKTRRRESGLAYFISVKPIYIELKLRERADKVRRTGENR